MKTDVVCRSLNSVSWGQISMALAGKRDALCDVRSTCWMCQDHWLWPCKRCLVQRGSNQVQVQPLAHLTSLSFLSGLRPALDVCLSDQLFLGAHPIKVYIRGLGLKSEASYCPVHQSLPFPNGDFRFKEILCCPAISSLWSYLQSMLFESLSWKGEHVSEFS